MGKYLLWDFDGTLGGRVDGLHGRAWSSSMLDAIKHFNADTKLLIEDISPYLRSGFPWHEPDVGHTHLSTPELWWEHIRSILSYAFFHLGFTEDEAKELAVIAQTRFVDVSTWELYEDTIPVLSTLKDSGWKHIIVSNHVPELELIINHLGLQLYIEDIINSAIIGYEKPNPAIYQQARMKASNSEEIWMIGDNINADVLGAEAVGISSILVRNYDERAKKQFSNLYELKEYLLNSRSHKEIL